MGAYRVIFLNRDSAYISLFLDIFQRLLTALIINSKHLNMV